MHPNLLRPRVLLGDHIATPSRVVNRESLRVDVFCMPLELGKAYDVPDLEFDLVEPSVACDRHPAQPVPVDQEFQEQLSGRLVLNPASLELHAILAAA